MKPERLALTAYILFIIGFLLPILCWAFWLPEALLIVACGLEILAFVFGKIAWPQRRAKIAVFGSIIFGLLAIWLVCAGLPTYQRAIRPTAQWMTPLNSDWVLQSPGKPYSIQTDSNVRKDGNDSIRFEIRGGESWEDQDFFVTYRSEIATEEFTRANATKWYSFAVFFPTNFPEETNRLVFAQWHDSWHLLQPGRIPSLAFRFVNGQFSITLRHSAEHYIRDPDSVPSEKLFKKNHFALGRWHNFVVQAKWSYQDDGFVNVWWNGKQIVQYRGPVGYDESPGPQFKFGLYRDATDKTYVNYFDEVRSGDSPKDVGFDPSTAIPYSDN